MTKITMGELADKFELSPDFRKLSQSTKKIYLRASKQIIPISSMEAQDIDTAYIQNRMDELAHKPGIANQYRSYMSRVFSFGQKRGLVNHNPATATDAFDIGEWEPWPLDLFHKVINDLEHLDKYHPLKTALLLAYYTGQRKTDILSLRWSDVCGISTPGPWFLSITQSKTRKYVNIKLHEVVVTNISPPKAPHNYLVNIMGNPVSAETLKLLTRRFEHTFGYNRLPPFHGLRKNAAMRMAEAGCTEREIMSVTGHVTTDMVSKYVRAVDQQRLAENAMAKLEAMR